WGRTPEVGEADPYRDGEVEPRALLAESGRGQVDGQLSQREGATAVPDRRPDPFLRLADRAAGEADHDERGHAGGDVDLDLDQPALEAVRQRGEHLGEHGRSLRARP